MNSILCELYDGKIYPNEQITGGGAEYEAKRNQATKELSKFESKLSAEDYKELEKVLALQNEVESYVHYQNFVYGVKFGTLLMAEIFMGKGEMVREE